MRYREAVNLVLDAIEEHAFLVASVVEFVAIVCAIVWIVLILR